MPKIPPPPPPPPPRNVKGEYPIPKPRPVTSSPSTL
jgi:hypothetical protein